MKPMKVMRYGSKYRYNQSQRKNHKKIIAVIAGIVAVALAAAVVVRLTVFDRTTAENEAVNLEMQEGQSFTMDVKTGDMCMLQMPDAVDRTKVVYTSSDPEIVRVDDAGHADALAEGTATVKAAAPNFAAECVFTVAENTEPERPSEVTTAIKANEDILAANREKGVDDLYSLTVNRRTNTVTAYTYDENGKYTVPVRAMVCSCGTGGSDITITGDFAIYFHEPWHPLFGDVYGMFVSGFEGAYLFHSVPYANSKHDTLDAVEFNKLGTNASQGCVRMMVSDVYWIFKNCDLDTPVHVIDADAKSDPLGKPAAVKLPESAVWDPTDDTEGNPYLGKMPTIEGAEDVTLGKGEQFDPQKGITAADICGNDISDRVKITGEVIAEKPGTYYLTYTVTDDFHLKTRVTRTVVVTE